MTEHNENEDTFENDEVENEIHEDEISKALRENFEEIQQRNSEEYGESQDLEEENDENDAVSDDKSEELLNKEEIDEVSVEQVEVDTEAKESVEKTVDDYPSTWKGDLKEKWANVDPAVRAEIHRREGDMLKGLEQYRGYANYAAEVANTFKPYDDVIRRAGSNQKEVLNTALGSMHRLMEGTPQQKAQELLNIASTYGVNLEDVTSTNDRILANQPLVDPEVEMLKNELAQQRQFLEQSNREKEQATLQTYQSELEEFANSPENMYFADVREEMARIFAGSQEEISLRDAYDKAVWANPVTREKLIAEQRETERRSAAEKAAAAKKTAKTNVASRGRPLAGVDTTNGTLDDVLAANLAKIRNRR